MFILEGLTFWALGGVLLFLAAGIVSAEMDSAIFATATFVIGLLVLQYGFGVPLVATLVNNPLVIIGYLVGYVAIGGLYTALWRWPEFIREHSKEINDDYLRWSSNISDTADNSFNAFLDSSHFDFNATAHKQRLGTWVGMWIFSAFWELSRKPAIWIWKISYNSFGSLFQKIGRRTAQKIHEKN